MVQEPSDRLATYEGRRHFERTPEPAPARHERPEERPSPALEFVVQKHDATRLHYDVRIEIAGTMMSWAVPRGPSYDPSVKRLAVETEDHPMAYNRFEGRIPDGEYGAGDVLIWDRGTYETVPPGNEEAMRAKGHILVRFAGEKLVGDWHFVRTTGRGKAPAAAGHGKAQWLMWKAHDEHADPGLDIVISCPGSVVSGKSATRAPRRKGASPAGQSAHELLATVGSPMRAVVAEQVDDPGRYIYEIKFDGYRLLAGRAGDDVRLVTRKANDWTDRFEPIVGAVRRLSAREIVLDGEACVLDDCGRSSFRMLQAWLGGDRTVGPLAFIAFDLLWLDGRDLRGLPLEERRDLLEALLKGAKAPLVFSSTLEGRLRDIEAVARSNGLEGLIAKRIGSKYTEGDSGAWRKLVFRRQQEVALAGYVPLVGSQGAVGALIIAVADGRGGFELAGKVGTGFTDKERRDLAARLDRAASSVPTVGGRPTIKGARWSAVKLVAEIELREWTKDGAARAGSFIALREDKDPADCVREPAATVEPRAPAEEEVASVDAPRLKAARRSKPPPIELAGLTNPDKVLFPRDGITKREVASYYSQISELVLPYLAGRPLGLQRWPNGIDEEAWFQQKAPERVPDFVRIVGAGERHGGNRKIVAENRETLVWLANLAALTLHQWSSHVPLRVTDQAAIDDALGRPDYTVIDLDPGDGTWQHVIDVAQALRGLLEELELESVVKTSGQRGLHILIPFRRGPDHAAATELGRKLATALAAGLPTLATVERMKAKRRGRLYIDYLQNGEGKTVVAPYAIRAKDGAPVSTPLLWSEVNAKLDPRALTLRTVPARVEKVGDLLAPLRSSRQTLPALK